MTLGPIEVVRMRLRDPSWTDSEGNLHFPDEDDWAPIKVLVIGECKHEETVCSDCAPQWGQDWQMHPEDHARLKEY